MIEHINNVKKRLKVWIFALVFSVFLITSLFFFFYLNSEVYELINQDDLEEIIHNNEDLDEYYKSQEGFEAHFITTANLVRAEINESSLQYFLIYFIPILLLSFVLANIFAKKIMQPVHNTFTSKQRFMEDVAHELRNPLSAIKLSAQDIILENKNLSDENLQTLKVIQRQVDNLIELSNDLITLEEDRAEEIKLINIREVIEDVLEQLKALAVQKNVKIQLNCDKNLEFKTNIYDISTLFKNLVSNAIKYSKPKDGKVNIDVTQNKKELNIQVQDNGIGIKQEDLTNIGNRFFRTSDAKGKQGSGLGISIVKKIIYKYKGKFIINSIYGEGTDIQVTLQNKYRNSSIN